MAGSLLAHLYPHIKGSQEDVATLTLCHIVSQSNALGSRFTQLLANRLHLSISEMLSYSTQVVGAEKERPDIVGVTHEGQEAIICEVKFFAALTSNQPNGYLKRLSGQTNCGLIFLCPQSRMIGLWNQVLTLAQPFNHVPLADNCVDMNGIRMGIISWNEVLEVLTQTAAERDPDMLTDLKQLVGFCHEVETNEFIPFKEEDFGADVAKSMDRYYIVIDDIIDLLFKQTRYHVTKKGLRATPQYRGYTQYIRISDFCTGINFNRYLWKKPTSICTPFWLYLTSNSWQQDVTIKQYLNSLPERWTECNTDGTVYIALEAKAGLSRTETAQYLCEQILQHIDRAQGILSGNRQNDS